MSNEFIQNTNLLFFGHSNAGKTSIIRLMKLKLFSMLLDKSRNTLRTINNNSKCLTILIPPCKLFNEYLK